MLAALLAFVNRTKDKTARNFIWAGAGTGLLLSAVIALLLTFAVSQAVAGGARETIEGFIGLAAVVMMLAVGHWLHNKSSGQAWSKYLAKQVGGALERGSLWSLFALSGLAILREGAETAVFYIGMAPSIESSQLIIGIIGALAALTIVGFCIIRFSVKLPIRPFMLVASLLIYYLVIRFMGDSIHSLQIGGLLPAHSKAWLPTISWIGAYPTLETFIPQLILLLFVIWQLVTAERNNKATKTA
ncbi:Ferrous iron permease EfeU precursor [compost metagenome]